MRRTLLWPLALCLLAASPLACGGEKEDPDAEAKLARDLKEAETRLRNNKTKDAEKIFVRVLEKHPDNADALAGLGKVRWEQKKLDEAETMLTKAAATKTDDAELHNALGQIFAQQDKHAEAAEAFGKAFAIEGENGDYGLAYGRELKLTKQYDKAEEVLRKVAEIDPMARFVHTELGDVLRETDRLDDALKTYMKAQSTYQSDKMARAGAAYVYEAKGDIKHAIDEWSAYIRMDCCSEFSNDVAKKKVMELDPTLEGGAPAEAGAPPADPPSPDGGDAKAPADEDAAPTQAG
jgi:tetratricopeptide (TPR) repeat protein